jgi:hypothetical protein
VAHNKAILHRPSKKKLGLDRLSLRPFVHGCASVAQKSSTQACRKWRRYVMELPQYLYRNMEEK